LDARRFGSGIFWESSWCTSKEKVMASGIAVTPERLREVSTQMGTAAADIDAILARLAGAVTPVRSEWVGAAQTQFGALWEKMQQDAGAVHLVLTGIAKLTQKAATSYAAMEQSIADSFNEFHIEPDGVAGRPGQATPTVTTSDDPATVEGAVAPEVGEDLTDVEPDGSDDAVDRSNEARRAPWDRFMTASARREIEEELIDQR